MPISLPNLEKSFAGAALELEEVPFLLWELQLLHHLMRSVEKLMPGPSEPKNSQVPAPSVCDTGVLVPRGSPGAYAQLCAYPRDVREGLQVCSPWPQASCSLLHPSSFPGLQQPDPIWAQEGKSTTSSTLDTPASYHESLVRAGPFLGRAGHRGLWTGQGPTSGHRASHFPGRSASWATPGFLRGTVGQSR